MYSLNLLSVSWRCLFESFGGIGLCVVVCFRIVSFQALVGTGNISSPPSISLSLSRPAALPASCPPSWLSLRLAYDGKYTDSVLATFIATHIQAYDAGFSSPVSTKKGGGWGPWCGLTESRRCFCHFLPLTLPPSPPHPARPPIFNQQRMKPNIYPVFQTNKKIHVLRARVRFEQSAHDSSGSPESFHQPFFL